MKRNALGLSLGLLLAAVGAVGAQANGMKDYGGGVPVPAPIPVSVYQGTWYLRGDIGVSFGNDPGLSTSGAAIGDRLNSYEYLPAWYDSDFGTDMTIGLGVGYVWSPRFRTDVTFDYQPEGEVKIDGSLFNRRIPIWTAYVDDKTTWDGVVTLFNAYWDMGNHSGFVPYVGAGLGFSWNQLRRVHASTYNGPGCRDCSTTVSERMHDVSLAFALTAGVSYDMGRSTYLDLNYRWLWVDGTDIQIGINNTAHTVSIDNLSEHQLRAGVRFMID